MHSDASSRPGNNCLWGSLSFQILRHGVNLRLDFGGTSVLISHARSRCYRTTSSLRITFTSMTSLRMVLRKRIKWKGWSLSAWLPFQICTWWDSGHISWNMFPRSRLNARAYSRVLSPSTSGSGLPYLIPPCTFLCPVPARCTWPFQSPYGIRNSDPVILAVTAPSWSKYRSLTSSLDHFAGHSHTEWNHMLANYKLH